MTKQDLCGMSEAEAMAFDDDGHGAAVGASGPAEDFGNAIPTTDDSGTIYWGPSSDVATHALNPDRNFSLEIGAQPTQEQEDQIIQNAIAVIKRAKGQNDKYRFFLLGFTMEGVGEETKTGGRIANYDLIATIETKAAVQAIESILMEEVARDLGLSVEELQASAAARSLEI